MVLTTDYIIVFMQQDGHWKLTAGSLKEIERSVLFNVGMSEALVNDFTRRANESKQDEILIGCTHASYTLVKPR